MGKTVSKVKNFADLIYKAATQAAINYLKENWKDIAKTLALFIIKVCFPEYVLAASFILEVLGAVFNVIPWKSAFGKVGKKEGVERGEEFCDVFNEGWDSFKDAWEKKRDEIKSLIPKDSLENFEKEFNTVGVSLLAIPSAFKQSMNKLVGLAATCVDEGEKTKLKNGLVKMNEIFDGHF